MKKVLIGFAVLSLAFLACSDNSSTSSNTNQYGSAGSKKVGLTTGVCLDNGLGLYKKSKSNELDKAYLVQDDGNYQIMVPALNDYCDIMVKFKSKRSDDTLEIYFNLEDAAVTDCVCLKDHWFNIKAEDADAKYFRYSGSLFRVVDEPAPVSELDSAALFPQAPTFTESDPHQEGSDVLGWCLRGAPGDSVIQNHKILNLDAWDKFRGEEDGKSISIARTYEIEEGYITFVLEGWMTCDDHLSKVKVFPLGDTLYVETGVEPNEVQTLEENEGCLCSTRMTFKIKDKKDYAHATHLVMDGDMRRVFAIMEGSKEQ